MLIRHIHLHTNQTLKIWFLDSGDIKMCKSIKISISKIWPRNNTFSTYREEKIKILLLVNIRTVVKRCHYRMFLNNYISHLLFWLMEHLSRCALKDLTITYIFIISELNKWQFKMHEQSVLCILVETEND